MTKQRRDYRKASRKRRYDWRRKKPFTIACTTYAGDNVYTVIPQHKQRGNGTWVAITSLYYINDVQVTEAEYQKAMEFMKYSKPMNLCGE